jgi:hypothetical protein
MTITRDRAARGTAAIRTARSALLAALLVVGTTLAGAVPAAGAPSADDIEEPARITMKHTILPTVKIVENGKAVDLTVKYVCSVSKGSSDVVLDIYVYQHPDPSRVVGDQPFVATCDGIPRRSPFRFRAGRYNRPFTPGPAEVRIFRQQCYVVGEESLGYWIWCSDILNSVEVVLTK